MPDDFQLHGTGLDVELQEFLRHTESLNAKMSAILADHIPILLGAASDESRRSARSTFNTAVRNQVLADLARASEDER